MGGRARALTPSSSASPGVLAESSSEVELPGLELAPIRDAGVVVCGFTCRPLEGLFGAKLCFLIRELFSCFFQEHEFPEAVRLFWFDCDRI